jgi:pimeloyl-ACP methyl ester carboxylesterase
MPASFRASNSHRAAVLTGLLAGFTTVVAAQQAGPLPVPTGEWRIGTRLLPSVVDSSRADSAFVRGYRTIPIQLWYPTRVTDGERASYLDTALLPALKAGSSSPDVVESWRYLRVNAVRDAPIAAGSFPLLLFSPGFGMTRAYYTSWIEELVSHGFMVAGIDHPYAGQSVIDGRVFDTRPNPGGPRGQTTAMAADLGVIASLLPVLLDRRDAQIGAIGHSIGGAAALEACRLYKRIGACINLDGDASFGEFAELSVGRSFMVVHQRPVFPDARPDGELARLGREIDSTWRAIAARQSQPVIRLSVRGTGHFSFSDALFIRPQLVAESAGIPTEPLLVLRGTTRVIAEYLRSVFRGYPGRVPPLPPYIIPTPVGMGGGVP